MEANKKFSGWLRRMCLIVLAGSSVLLFLAAKPQSEKFSKYKPVEAYEIRPGILMMPRYAEDGQVCEVGLERLHYKSDYIDMNSEMAREEINRIAYELTNVDERGPEPNETLKQEIGPTAGVVMIQNEENEKILVQIFNLISADFDEKHQLNMKVSGNIAAVIKWKNRKCQ
jgi:hypothetical protein